MGGGYCIGHWLYSDQTCTRTLYLVPALAQVGFKNFIKGLQLDAFSP